MKKISILVLLQLFLFIGCSKDDTSSTKEPPDKEQPATTAEKITDAEWETNKAGQEVLWKYHQFDDLFYSNQSITVFEINKVPSKISVEIPYVESGFLKTSDGAIQKRALVAVNGSYFDTKKGGSTVFFKNEGDIINKTRSGFNSYRENAGFAISSAGEIAVIDKPEFGWETAGYHTLLVSGPLLMLKGELVNQESNKFNDKRHPRTAIGMKSDGSLIAVVVDGRSSEAQGMTIDELAEVMEALGCEEAMNLDGGGSSTAWVKNRGVVNYPSDNKKFDHNGERGVATVITFSAK